MKNFLICIAFGFWALWAHAQSTETRVALVIGNSDYKDSPLKNPVNDAIDMASQLKGLGFSVIERKNLTTKQIGGTLREFRAKLTPGSVALVFYAGHGVTIKGKNYLPAVDADIKGEEDVPNQSLGTEQIMDVLAEAKTRLNLVFLDACRNNPYARGFRSTQQGLAKENAPSGTLMSFATKPGSVAADGTGRNGLYTSVLLEQIKNNGQQPIELMLKKVVTGVRVASNNQQEPWMEGSIEGDFCFGSCSQTALGQAPAELNETQKEDNFWNDAKAAGNVKAFDAYIKKYPNGRYVDLAKANIDRLSTNSNANSKPASNETVPVPPKETVSREELKRQEEQRRKEEEANRLGQQIRVAYIYPEGFFKLTGEADNKENRTALQLKVKTFAEKYKIQLILKEAVFIVGKADLTNVFYAYTKGDPVPNNFVANLSKAPSNFLKFIDSNKIFKDSEPAKNAAKKLEVEFKKREQEIAAMSDTSSAKYLARKKEFEENLAARKSEEMQKVLEIANQKVKTLSQEKGYNIVLQEALYAAPELDMTQELLMMLR